MSDLKSILHTTQKHTDRLRGLGIKNIRDLLFYFPRTYTDQSKICKIMDMRVGEINTVKGTISSFFSNKTRNGKSMTRAILTDNTGSIEVIWFNQPYILRVMPKNSIVILSGKLKHSFGKITLMSPSYEIERKEQLHTGRIVPVYHETEGLSSKWLREKLKPIIDEWGKTIDEFMPKEILTKYSLIDLKEAIKEVHFPKDKKSLIKARKRLSFDELFLIQLKALIKKKNWQTTAHKDEKKIVVDKELNKRFLKYLSFELTNAQKKVVEEILKDLQESYPMSRLVQGDVGSGKTVVAAIAILQTCNSGYQVAVMAPTEILARQHYKTLSTLLQKFGLNIQFISGSTRKSQKEEIINQLKTGTCDLVIGTHALIQDKVGFARLGLAVIDEQHRFGVEQRSILKSQGSPHLLNLTATPIPRTLAITIYGDQDVSEIDEMPKGRKEIITRIVPENKRGNAYLWIKDQVAKGHQVYIICPLIDESDAIEAKAVTKEFKHLQKNVFKKLKLGLLHGKLKQIEKDKIMDDFKENKIQILVSTSVIEVGIDVPNATIMVIEGAERFGLSQLHQFRGRVGRGEVQSYCFLFTNNISIESQNRLNAMRKYSSGFKLAEIDLQIRGPGEIFGIRQSGIPDLKMASLTDYETIKKARAAAGELLTKDTKLTKYPLLQKKIAELEEVFVQD